MAERDHGSGDRKVDRRQAKADNPVDGRHAEPGEHAKLSNKHYMREMEKLQEELVKLQYWVREKGLKIAIVFEGRDAAGKGGVIKRITERTNPRVIRVVALGIPTERERSQWYFQRWATHLPAAGEVVLFDRSWYTRALTEHVMGFCSEDEYHEFLRSCPQFESMLIRSGIGLLKYWFSVSDEVQERRFQARASDPRRRWKLSPMDIESRDRWVELLACQGCDVRVHGHQELPVVRGRGRRQKARAAELHQPHPPERARTRTSCRRAPSSRRAPNRAATSAPRSTVRRSCRPGSDAAQSQPVSR